MEKYEIKIPKIPKIVIVIAFFIILSVLGFLIYEVCKDESIFVSDELRAKSQAVYCALLIIPVAIIGLFMFRVKITVDGDKIIVRKMFKTTEYSLNKLYRISVETKYGRKPKSEITLYKEKYVYFSFGEDMINADLLIETLVKRCYIEREPDGSYKSNKQ